MRRSLEFAQSDLAPPPGARARCGGLNWPRASGGGAVGEVSSNPDGSADHQNTGIKNIKRTGRGFRNEHNYRTRILLTSAARTAA